MERLILPFKITYSVSYCSRCHPNFNLMRYNKYNVNDQRHTHSQNLLRSKRDRLERCLQTSTSVVRVLRQLSAWDGMQIGFEHCLPVNCSSQACVAVTDNWKDPSHVRLKFLMHPSVTFQLLKYSIINSAS